MKKKEKIIIDVSMCDNLTVDNIFDHIAEFAKTAWDIIHEESMTFIVPKRLERPILKKTLPKWEKYLMKHGHTDIKPTTWGHVKLEYK